MPRHVLKKKPQKEKEQLNGEINSRSKEALDYESAEDII
jgi:hypothetical protein